MYVNSALKASARRQEPLLADSPTCNAAILRAQPLCWGKGDVDPSGQALCGVLPPCQEGLQILRIPSISATVADVQISCAAPAATGLPDLALLMTLQAGQCCGLKHSITVTAESAEH